MLKRTVSLRLLFVILSTHNIRFGREIRKLIFDYAILIEGLISDNGFLYHDNCLILQGLSQFLPHNYKISLLKHFLATFEITTKHHKIRSKQYIMLDFSCNTLSPYFYPINMQDSNNKYVFTSSEKQCGYYMYYWISCFSGCHSVDRLLELTVKLYQTKA